jgi:hypothetical protein
MKKFIFFNLLALFGYIFNANAAEQKLIGEYGDWFAYYYRDNAGPVCYIASTPKKDEGKYTKRGDIYIVVTHRPNEKSYDVVNINAGYNYKPSSETELKIGTQTFKLFVSEDKAWATSTKDDKAIVAAMKRGSRMIVNGTSSKGTKTKDTYSLNGFTSAYKAISNKCK